MSPADKFRGPDGLSRREPNPEDFKEETDDWLDDIALYTTIRDLDHAQPHSIYASSTDQDHKLHQILKFLVTLQLPELPSEQARKRFITRALQFYIKDGTLFKRNKDKAPLKVIFDEERRQEILYQAHEDLGHRGESAVFFQLKKRFYWPHLYCTRQAPCSVLSPMPNTEHQALGDTSDNIHTIHNICKDLCGCHVHAQSTWLPLYCRSSR